MTNSESSEPAGEKCSPVSADSSQGESYCVVCEISDSQSKIDCKICSHTLHKDCAKQKELCYLCFSKKRVEEERESAADNLAKQAKKMLDLSQNRLVQACVGDTVRIPVPGVDRGKGDARNVLGVILDKTDDDFFRIGTRDGIVKNLYARSQFTICSEKLITLNDVPQVECSLRSIATSQSNGTGQGMVKCSCTTKCMTKKCKCLKSNRLCNSRCHDSLSCCNK